MPEPTLTFDTSRARMTIAFHEPPTPETLEAISVRLTNDKVRTLHAMVDLDWRDPGAPDWDDPRYVAELERALNPSLEAFIFETPTNTIARQSYNTIGDIGDVLEACPKLQRAFFTGCSTMRKTRHAHLRELHLIGNPLDDSVISGLGTSQFPALEKLALEQYDLPARELAAALRAIEAPRLSHACIDGVPVIDFLTIIGTAALPWTLCLRDPSFDDVDRLFSVIEQHNALRSGKLWVDSGKFFDSEIAKLQEMDVTVASSHQLFNQGSYSDW